MNWIKKYVAMYQHRITGVDVAMSIIGGFLFPLEYFFYAFLFGRLLLWPILTLAYHEYISHRTIDPRNKIIESFIMILMVLYTWTNFKNKKNFHFLHHKYTNTEKDPTWQKLTSCSSLAYILNLGPTIDLKLDIEEYDNIKKSNWDFVNKHYIWINFILLSIWLIFLPLWSFFIFYVYPKALGGLISNTVDVLFHKYEIEDQPWTVIFFGSSAWHKSHHLSWKDMYFGSKPWYYINTEVWYYKLLFNPIK